MPLRIWCYRAGSDGQAPSAILERWRWQNIPSGTRHDRKKFDDGNEGAYDSIK